LFDKRKHIPIEQRNYSVYYVVFSGLLFLGTMWAVYDEISTRRPWKEEQKKYYALAEQKITAEIEQTVANIDSLALLELDMELQAAHDSMRGVIYTKVLTEYDETLERLNEENREFQFAKSRGDEAYYFYKKSVHEGREDLGQKAKLEKSEAEMAKHQAAAKQLEQRRDSLTAILDVYRQNLRRIQASRAELLKPVEKLQTKLNRVASASIEIKQVMILDYDRNPFNDPKARVDRCQTCHLGWNEDSMEDAPQPFTKHSLPELLAIHDPEVYGCTPCHRGQGPALTAGFAHGDADKYWENPLLKGKDAFAACNECHESQSSLTFGPEFGSAKRLMIESGCHGCHEIKGYTDLPKIGPELNRMGYKTTAEWVFRWVKDPRNHNPHTRMPNFGFTDKQAEAVTAYLMSISGKFELNIPKGVYAGGDPRRGKTLLETIGCQGCHVVSENTNVRQERGTSYDVAPELTRVGSKVNPDWAYDWLKNPRHYNPTTRMPNLRLTDGEARDLVAHLMTLRDGRSLEQPNLNLSSRVTIARGEKLIREYGCNGCHAIYGMEKEGRVSVSLSNFGRKLVEEMDFGDTHIPHTWHDWVFTKLKKARAFATDRIEQKMPVFSFTDDEITSLRMFLLSQTKDEPDQKYVQPFNKRQEDIEAGRRIAISYNCQQCHQLEGIGAYIGVTLEDVAFLPPIITGEGKKVQEPWLHDFLKSPAPEGQSNSIRPWITIRMPTFQFTEDEITKLTKYFLGLSNQELELRDYKGFGPKPELVPVGKMIFTDFQCAKCHPSGKVIPKSGEVSTSDLAPFLGLARDRLKPEWILEWLLDPGKLQAGTRMPTYFPDGQSPLPDELGGDAMKQIEAIRDYVMSIGELPRPVVSAR